MPTRQTQESTVLAVIPARGGSKGVPRKNLAPVAGKPLIAIAVGAAVSARMVDRVVVSTDDDEIAAVAAAAGAEIVRRPSVIATDDASSESALLHVLQQLQDQGKPLPDVLVFLQCTSPQVDAEHVDGVVMALLDQGADSALTVVRNHGFLWRQGPDGDAVGVNHDKGGRERRQDREPEYLETGAAYAMRVPGFLKSRHRFYGRTVFYEMPLRHTIEIDEPGDLAVAEALLAASSGPDDHWFVRRPKAVVFDFDGVFTDNRVLVLQDGSEAVLCSRSDGHGVACLKQAGIPMVILSKERNPVVSARAAKLGIEVKQAVDDKLAALRTWSAARGIDLADVAFVGNDAPDVPSITSVGYGIAVADAEDCALDAARYVLTARGGFGALRELADRILAAEGD